MAAPFPNEATQGEVAYGQISNQVYASYVWIARLSDEIENIDADVNLLKVAQLAFTQAKLFADLTNDASSDFKASVRLRFEASGLEWATQNDMVTDLVAIRSEVLALRTWVDTNLAAAKTPSVPTYSTATAYPVDVVDTLAKPQDVVTEVAKVRDLFA